MWVDLERMSVLYSEGYLVRRFCSAKDLYLNPDPYPFTILSLVFNLYPSLPLTLILNPTLTPNPKRYLDPKLKTLFCRTSKAVFEFDLENGKFALRFKGPSGLQTILLQKEMLKKHMQLRKKKLSSLKVFSNPFVNGAPVSSEVT